MIMNDYNRCFAEISLKAIGHNIDEAKKRVGDGVKILAVVKADAYGHGAVRVAQYLEDRVDFFAVATVDEAAQLRNGGVKRPILILGYTSPREYEEMIRLDIRPAIYHLEDAERLDRAAEKLGTRAEIHIAVDTGMTRIGFQVTEEDADVIAKIARLPHVDIEGIFTHLSCCDQQDQTFTRGQLDCYRRMLALLDERGVKIPIRHVCNSAGIMQLDEARYEMVRSGITTYGIYPSEEVNKERMELIPALSWKTHVVHVKEVGPGRGVSYGATYVTNRPVTRIATVSVGYADGYPRALSSKGRVLIHGKYAPILGRVCMDQMMVDVSEIDGVKNEDIVTLVGRDGDNCIPIEEVADPAGRFNYEQLCLITDRVKRIYDVPEKKEI